MGNMKKSIEDRKRAAIGGYSPSIQDKRVIEDDRVGLAKANISAESIKKDAIEAFNRGDYDKACGVPAIPTSPASIDMEYILKRNKEMLAVTGDVVDRKQTPDASNQMEGIPLPFIIPAPAPEPEKVDLRTFGQKTMGARYPNDPSVSDTDKLERTKQLFAEVIDILFTPTGDSYSVFDPIHSATLSAMIQAEAMTRTFITKQ